MNFKCSLADWRDLPGHSQRILQHGSGYALDNGILTGPSQPYLYVAQGIIVNIRVHFFADGIGEKVREKQRNIACQNDDIGIITIDCLRSRFGKPRATSSRNVRA